MKILIAPDSFKESLSAAEAAAAIEAGFREALPQTEYVLTPIADGGEGTAQALVDALGGSWRRVDATRPNGGRGAARYGLVERDRLAVIEMAEASGLELVPPEARDPMTATSRGVGELMRDALDQGARRLLIGIGGSATNDAGAGMLQALGARLLDAAGEALPPGGAALARLARIDLADLDPRLAETTLDIACDVTNPLTGPNGASHVFGPQKGATPAMAQALDQALARLAEIVARDLGVPVADAPGAGAAGGLGAGLIAVCGARLRPGCEVVFEALDMERMLTEADLAITGEGRSDGQTLAGKAPCGLARLAKRVGTPVILISGALTRDAGALLGGGVDAMFSAALGPGPLDEALRDGAENLRRTARNAAETLKLGGRLAGKL